MSAAVTVTLVSERFEDYGNAVTVAVVPACDVAGVAGAGPIPTLIEVADTWEEGSALLFGRALNPSPEWVLLLPDGSVMQATESGPDFEPAILWHSPGTSALFYQMGTYARPMFLGMLEEGMTPARVSAVMDEQAGSGVFGVPVRPARKVTGPLWLTARPFFAARPLVTA